MSQDHSRNLAYGREAERDKELPVPTYSGIDHIVRSRNNEKCHKNINDIFGVTNNSEQSNPPSSGIGEVQEGYAAAYANKQQPLLGSQMLSHLAPNYNGTPTIAHRHPSEIQKSQLHPHSSLEDNKKDVSGQTAVSVQKVPPNKQLEEYKKKATQLRQELETLKDQRNELRGDGTRSPSPDTKRFLKENTKLQLEIHNKLKTINNVLDMISGIMGDHTNLHEPQSPERKPRQKWSQKFNYIFYDPEMHWCRVCNVFPQTAKDYLSHLHSPDHQMNAAEHGEAPWHSIPGVDQGFSNLPTAPTKRTPIRGLQFFVPASAWYCKLCDQFIGDLHCASAHIKSILHSKNYNKFVQQNPHWETDWVSDRQKAFERARPPAAPRPADTPAAARVRYTHTLTISKDVHTKRPPKTPPLELENQGYKNKKSSRCSSPSSGEISSDSDEDMTLTNKRLKSKEMDGSKRIDSSESPARSESRLSDDGRSRMKKKDERQRSSSRDRELIREMQQKIKDSEHRGRARDERSRRDRHRDRSRRARTRSRDRRDSSRDRRPASRDRRPASRDRRPASRDRRPASRDRRPASRDRRPASRDRRPASRDRRPASRDRRPASRDRRPASRDRRPASRDRRSASRDRRPASRGRRPATRDTKGGSRDRRGDSRDRPKDSQVAEVTELLAPLQAPLPTPLQLPLPPPTAMPTLAAMPPVVIPPPQALPPGPLPDVSQEFKEALEMIFPTDPAKCAEMLDHQLHQPSLLGPPPRLPLPFPLGFPPMFPFNYGAPGVFPAPSALPQVLQVLRPSHRGQRPSRPARPKNKKSDELVMLGIDASDVGAAYSWDGKGTLE